MSRKRATKINEGAEENRKALTSKQRSFVSICL
jgi:ribosomal protein L7Ae-like RNA K-turn-binding protein